MATTTLQKQPHPAQMDPRLRRAVYAKYREMLVSKNSQANEMIAQMPAYMVQQNRNIESVLLNKWVEFWCNVQGDYNGNVKALYHKRRN